MAVDVAEVVMWGRVVGAVAWDREREVGAFEYTPAFRRAEVVEPSPLAMPVVGGQRVYVFPELGRAAFHGLPGMLADCLPDKFGNLLIDAWLARSGRERSSFSPVERLCYLGARGMGALEFQPTLGRRGDRSVRVEIDSLVELAGEALAEKAGLAVEMKGGAGGDVEAIRDILRVGTSAGGARAKAIVAWNEVTGEVRSGQVTAPEGFGYWLLKFDGVSGNRDKELEDPKGYGAVEYAYSLMAKAAGVEMTECRLFEEGGRRHFMTRRFDRGPGGEKLHLQSLCGLAHFDFNRAGAYGYEQALEVGERLGLEKRELLQLFRRMVFNVLARNQDDHTKNIGFLMDKRGRWRLAPAYDVTYAYNPDGRWTGWHQMTVNGKRDGFERADLLAVAKRFRLATRPAVVGVLEEVDAAVGRWGKFAQVAGVGERWAGEIGRQHRRLGGIG